MEKAKLKEELKLKMIEFLNLAPMTPAEIKDDAPFFGDGLGLDSIDSLELIVMLKREYGIDIQDPKEGRKILVNINTMADYVEENRTI
ncbi:MAG: phosphopantetheine-binding protein [Bacteroidia bacterium]